MSAYLKQELAWAAGFFDGEGSTVFVTMKSYKGRRYPHLRMQVCQAEPLTLRRFNAAVRGLGKVSGPYHSPSHHGKTTWQWRVYARDSVQAVALYLWPYLSQPKRDQMERAIERYREFKCPLS